MCSTRMQHKQFLYNAHTNKLFKIVIYSVSEVCFILLLLEAKSNVTVHAKTLRKSSKIFVELRADFATPIFILHLLQISCG